MYDQQFDFIIVGSGAGGATMARQLAPHGFNILVLERGGWLPREKKNWDPTAVAVNGCYETTEKWLNESDEEIKSNAHYNVGGNTKFWGAALFRLRERDFEKVIHPDGISPEWPLKYKDFEPYYTRGEAMYDCRGVRGEDHTEPPIAEDYPHAPIQHEPMIEEISDLLKKKGMNPFHLPTAIRRDDHLAHLSECIRCNTCDGFPCLTGAKADAEYNGMRPALKSSGVTLLTGAKVERILTNASGTSATGVEATIEGKKHVFKANIVISSCGAINSAALLLRSANDKHPNGLANGSDQVGRNYMYHLLGGLVMVSCRQNPTIFEKTLGVNDFYWGEKDYDFPMGNVQSTGQVLPEMLAAQFKEPVGASSFEEMCEYSTDWWVMTEDVPDSNNRISLKNGQIKLSYTENNRKSFDRLVHRWAETLTDLGFCDEVLHHAKYRSSKVGTNGVAHQCGTCRFGEDPKTSVLDLNCKAHELDNLYVVDSSFYPSSAALNPTNTLIANAIRVSDHLLERMNVSTTPNS